MKISPLPRASIPYFAASPEPTNNAVGVARTRISQLRETTYLHRDAKRLDSFALPSKCITLACPPLRKTAPPHCPDSLSKQWELTSYQSYTGSLRRHKWASDCQSLREDIQGSRQYRGCSVLPWRVLHFPALKLKRYRIVLEVGSKAKPEEALRRTWCPAWCPAWTALLDAHGQRCSLSVRRRSAWGRLSKVSSESWLSRFGRCRRNFVTPLYGHRSEHFTYFTFILWLHTLIYLSSFIQLHSESLM
jgi:hypothetical protein